MCNYKRCLYIGRSVQAIGTMNTSDRVGDRYNRGYGHVSARGQTKVWASSNHAVPVHRTCGRETLCQIFGSCLSDGNCAERTFVVWKFMWEIPYWWIRRIEGSISIFGSSAYFVVYICATFSHILSSSWIFLIVGYLFLHSHFYISDISDVPDWGGVFGMQPGTPWDARIFDKMVTIYKQIPPIGLHKVGVTRNRPLLHKHRSSSTTSSKASTTEHLPQFWLIGYISIVSNYSSLK